MNTDPGRTVTGQPPEPGGAVTATRPVAGAPGLAVAEPAVSCAGVTYRFGDHVAVTTWT